MIYFTMMISKVNDKQEETPCCKIKKEFDSLAKELSLLVCLSNDNEGIAATRMERKAYAEGYIQRDMEQTYDSSELEIMLDDALKYVHEDKEINETMQALREVFNYAYRAGFNCRSNLWQRICAGR